ncbi:MAG: prephenate dehydrogenase [Thermodesulfobacteriota bacterium]
MNIHFKKVAVIGVGLIGGSLSRIMKEKGLVSCIVGIGRGIENLKAAMEIGVIDEYTSDVRKGVKGAELVILATPVNSILKLVEEIAPCLDRGAIITDVGSVKEEIVNSVEDILPSHLFFVGGHPIAGTERSGARASFSTLFKDRNCILTPTDRTDQGALDKIKSLWEEAGSDVTLMDTRTHDMILSTISHLPHIVAYSLVNTLLNMDDFENILSYSAGGFKDFTRIVLSSPEMWRDIVLLNRREVLNSITLFQNSVERLKGLIEAGDGEKILDEFKKAREIKEMSFFGKDHNQTG